jgi:hypothetical protein
MAEPQIITPAPGCRIVTDETDVVLFAQPPEVLKGLLREKITRFDTLVLTDIREKDGALLNNLEFPLYFFLFIARGLAEKRKLNLVGESETISQAMRLLRFTLIGPTRAELTNGIPTTRSSRNGSASPRRWQSRIAMVMSGLSTIFLT